jgi:hypothetical protein
MRKCLAAIKALLKQTKDLATITSTEEKIQRRLEQQRNAGDAVM